MELTVINPETLARPRGFSHGIKGRGDLVFVAGQIGWNRDGKMVSDDFVFQFEQALMNVLEVVWAAGGSPPAWRG
jgi:enamine deaminase RidA (YjgF/YER057c/UK114 family)